MKKILFCALAFCMLVPCFAQNKKTLVKTGSTAQRPVLSLYVGYRLPEYNCKVTLPYYEDDYGDPVYHGNYTIVGSTNQNGLNVNYNYSTTYKDGKEEGPLSVVIKESYNGKKFNLNLQTNLAYDLRNSVSKNRVSDFFKCEVEYPDGNKTKKESWYYKLDEKGILTHFKVTSNDETVDLKFDYAENGYALVTGNYLNKRYIKGIVLTESNKELLTKYSEGKITEEDLLKAGYYIKELDNKLELGVAGSNQFTKSFSVNAYTHKDNYFFTVATYALVKVDGDVVTDIAQLSSYLDPTKKNNWFEYAYNNQKLTLNGESVYALNSVAKEFLQKADSITKQIAAYQVKAALAKYTQQSDFKQENYPAYDEWGNESNYKNLQIVNFSNVKVDDKVYKDGNSNRNFYLVTVDVLNFEGAETGYAPYKLEFAFHTDSNQRYLLYLRNKEKLPSKWDEYPAAVQALQKAYNKVIEDNYKMDKYSVSAFNEYYNGLEKKLDPDVDITFALLEKLNQEIKNFEYFLQYRDEVDDNWENVQKHLVNFSDANKACKKYYDDWYVIWSPNAIEELNDAKKLQELTIEYAAKRAEILNNNASILASTAALKDVTKAYSAYVESMDLTWSPVNTVEKLDVILAVQKATSNFVELRNTIASNDSKIVELGNQGKNIAKAYKAYMKTADIAWDATVNVEKLAKVIADQEACIKLLSDQNIKDIDKAVKKEKLADLGSILTKYAQ